MIEPSALFFAAVVMLWIMALIDERGR